APVGDRLGPWLARRVHCAGSLRARRGRARAAGHLPYAAAPGPNGRHRTDLGTVPGSSRPGHGLLFLLDGGRRLSRAERVLSCPSAARRARGVGALPGDCRRGGPMPTSSTASNLGSDLASAEARVEAHSAGLKKELGVWDLALTQILFIVGLTWIGVAGKLGPSHVVFWLLALVLF